MRRAIEKVLGASNVPDELIDRFANEMANRNGDANGGERVGSDGSRSQRWLSQLRVIESMIPPHCGDEATRENAMFSITRIYRGGEIEANCVVDRNLYRVYVDCGGGYPPAGCTCPDSSGEGPCRHIEALVSYLTDRLESNESTLHHRINRGAFAFGKPDPELFEPDGPSQAAAPSSAERQTGLMLRRLDAILTSRPTDGIAAEDDGGLPDVRTQPEERVLWGFTFRNERLGIAPRIQKKKKSGSGFTKGRRATLQTVREHESLETSAADRRVIGAIRFAYDASAYHPQWTISPVEAAAYLVGEANVTLNDEPCEVVRQAPVVGMVRTSQGWSFTWVDENGEPLNRHAWIVNDRALLIRPSPAQASPAQASPAQLSVAELPPGTGERLEQLLRLPPIHEDLTESLIERVRKLDGAFPIRLPKEHAGEVIADVFRPAVLLRSRPDGTLDYGIRVVTGDGRRRIPGRGAAIRPGHRDDKPVQWYRDLAAEVATAERLADRLGMPTGPEANWGGSIDDFERGLRLIETLQDAAGEVELMWDRSQSDKPPRVLGRLSGRNVRVEISKKRNWFGIDGECELGGQSFALAKFLESLPSGASGDRLRGEYVRVGDGEWARISTQLRERLCRLRDATHVERDSLRMDATAAPAIRDLADDAVEMKATKGWHECVARLSRADRLDPALPEGLRAELRDYQIDGYKWMRRLAEWGVGGVLADDMGLGKTLQTLAVLLDRVSEGPALVIAPTSVGFNWVRESERFAPDLRVHLYRETERGEFLERVGPGDLVVCSYGLALRDRDPLGKVPWGTVVMDEAQAVKNSRSKTSQAIAGFDAKWTVALTGTPVENHLGELWSLFRIVSPGVFGGWDQFRNRYANRIEKLGDPEARRALASRIRPFVLRRTKSQVLTELPPRTEMTLEVDLSPAEREMYDRVRRSAIGEADEIAALGDTSDQRFKLLALLTRLRQFACHPGLVQKDWNGSSAKLDLLCETIDELREEGHRALVFSQFTQHLALIRDAFEARGIRFEYLDGSTPAKARRERVDAFQNGDADVFLISLKAGGTGLNLTAADYVIHADPWWNPAVEDQATDRAHRIGQDKPVMVYRLITKGTIEEEILKLHETKRDLMAGVLEGTTEAAKLSTDELIGLIRGADR